MAKITRVEAHKRRSKTGGSTHVDSYLRKVLESFGSGADADTKRAAFVKKTEALKAQKGTVTQADIAKIAPKSVPKFTVKKDPTAAERGDYDLGVMDSNGLSGKIGDVDWSASYDRDYDTYRVTVDGESLHYGGYGISEASVEPTIKKWAEKNMEGDVRSEASKQESADAKEAERKKQEAAKYWRDQDEAERKARQDKYNAQVKAENDAIQARRDAEAKKANDAAAKKKAEDAKKPAPSLQSAIEKALKSANGSKSVADWEGSSSHRQEAAIRELEKISKADDLEAALKKAYASASSPYADSEVDYYVAATLKEVLESARIKLSTQDTDNIALSAPESLDAEVSRYLNLF